MIYKTCQPCKLGPRSPPPARDKGRVCCMLHIILQFYAPIPLPYKVLWVGGASMGSLLCTWVCTLPLQRGALPYKKNACVVFVWLYLYILFWCLQSVVTAFDLESYVLLKDLIFDQASSRCSEPNISRGILPMSAASVRSAPEMFSIKTQS